MQKNSKLGSKHLCESCGTKFYDLGAEIPTCPKCGWSADSEESMSEVREFAGDEHRVHDPEDTDSTDDFDEDFDKAAEANAFSAKSFDDDDDDDDDENGELSSTDTDQIIKGDDDDDDDDLDDFGDDDGL